jgi:hypothetical protein
MSSSLKLNVMKRISIIALFITGLFWGACNKNKPEKTADLPGDNLDLYAVLDVFKSSANLEAFEKALNDKSNKVNNLDLNMDGKVDYIKVIDHKDGDDHAITLRVPVSKTESQDVAVIEIEKTGEKTANIQVIGDEGVYGKDVVIEPKDGAEKSGYVFTTVAVNVYDWPVVTYVYSPAYVVYVSPYEYEYYPVWWDPWEPVAYEAYYPVVYRYHSYYYPVGHPRFERAHTVYYSNRVVSGYVQQNYNNGSYRTYYHDNGRRGNQNLGKNMPRGNGNANTPRGNGGMPRGQNGINRTAPQGKHNDYSPSREPKPGNNNNVRREDHRSPQPGPANGNRNGGYRQPNNDHRQNAPQMNQRSPQPGPQNQRGGNPNGGQRNGGGNVRTPQPQHNASPAPRQPQPHQGAPGPKGGGRPR